MKIYIKILMLLIIGSIASSCNKKDDFNYPAGKVGISSITNYPILTLTGDNYVTVPNGSAYTEPGVTAKEGEKVLTVKTTGTVNTSTNGVYTLVYSATNKDGFAATTKRTVIVYSTDASASVNDLSGNYARNTNGQIAVWSKLAPGVYKVFNPGGAGGTNLTVIAFNPTGYKIFLPSQLASDGSLTSSDSEDYSGLPLTYKWKIINSGYGPSVRTFTKQ
jgi:hypothetical protein